MMSNFKKWAAAAAVRAVKTVAQCAIGMLTTDAVGIMDVDWIAVASACALAGIISLLTSTAGLPELKE